MTENNPDWIQPELLDEVVINVSKKDIEENLILERIKRRALCR